ncbi:MAG: preprotein translocase subunit YajC [Clostridia bacterium]|jgi:preprotein translocase subunit YajC
MLLSALLATTPPATQAASQDPGAGSSLIFYVAIIGIVVYFILMTRSQKKNVKKRDEMLNTIKDGTVVTTKGGIVGKVVNIKEDDLTIESGIDGTKIMVKRWAIMDIQNENEINEIKEVKK